MSDIESKNDAYLDAYLKKNSQFNQSGEIDNSNKNVLPLLVFISLPFILTVVLNFLLLNDNNKDNELKTTLNRSYNFSDEIIYKNILQKDMFFQDNYGLSKFDEVATIDKNNLSNRFVLSKKKFPSSYSTPLKKINLSNNINQKKKEFINVVLPIIVDQNRKIIVLRQRLIDSKKYLNQNKTISQTDQNFINNLATEYSVNTENRHKIDIINDLLISVDVIPNSIALAQAANESGWGSSRFATEYNALYGEYTYDSKIGIVPSQREEGKKHLVKYFKTIDKSVESYFININSHFAYNKFRKLRKILRDQNNSFNINLLVNNLDVYAEDSEYVDTIISIIQDNELTQYDTILSLLTKS